MDHTLLENSEKENTERDFTYGQLRSIQDEAQWLISNQLTNATTVPNFINYVYEDGLKSVKPGAVNIIG